MAADHLAEIGNIAKALNYRRVVAAEGVICLMCQMCDDSNYT